MKAGIYQMSNAEYHSHKEAQSKGMLEQMLKSPAHYQFYLNKQQKQTPALIMGSLIHTLVLEPHLFATEYVFTEAVPDDEWVQAIIHGCYVFDGSCRRGKAWDAFKLENSDKPILLKSQHEAAVKWLHDCNGKTAITEEQYEKAIQLCDCVYANPVARSILEHPDRVVEQSLFWEDEETGLLCKCRPDIRIGDRAYDLKTTKSVSPYGFASAVKGYGYHRQAAFYTEGMTAHFGKMQSFGFIAAETSDLPMCTVFHRLEDEAMQQGKEQIHHALNRVAVCQFSGEWEGYPHQYDVIGLGGAYDFEASDED